MFHAKPAYKRIFLVEGATIYRGLLAGAGESSPLVSAICSNGMA